MIELQWKHLPSDEVAVTPTPPIEQSTSAISVATAGDMSDIDEDEKVEMLMMKVSVPCFQVNPGTLPHIKLLIYTKRIISILMFT